MSQINDLELAVRTIENLLPDMPNAGLQKWHGILNTALMKIEAELNSTMMHHCDLCGTEEYGYRTELPIGWRGNDDQKLCFDHEHIQLKRTPKPLEKIDVDQTVEELMAIL